MKKEVGKGFEYRQVPLNVLPNGLTLLQGNPEFAVDLRGGSRTYGWMFYKHHDGQFVTYEKLKGAALDQAIEQAADYAVVYPKARFA